MQNRESRPGNQSQGDHRRIPGDKESGIGFFGKVKQDDRNGDFSGLLLYR